MSSRHSGGSYEDTKIETFDDFNQSETANDSGNVIPFQFNSELSTLEWLQNFWMVSKERSKSRCRHYKRNLFLYKGVHWKGESSSKRAPKQVVNFINEMVDAKVSNRAKNKVSFQAIPLEYEQSAINAARGVKKILTSRSEQIGFDKLNRSLDRVMFTFGHAFFHIFWNPEAGGLQPKYKAIKDLGAKEFKKLKKALGTDQTAFNGDVCCRILGPNRIFPEMNKETGLGPEGDVNYLDTVEMVHIEELRAEYPNVDFEITPDCADDFFWRMNDEETNSEYVVKHVFHHRVTKFNKGAKIVWCSSGILDEAGLGYDHGELPFVEARDTEIYEEYFGRSDIETVYGMQRFYNAIQSFQARDVSLGSAPKWVLPKGSVKPANINNEFGTMEYTGPTAPKLETYKATPDQGFLIQDRLEAKISKGMKAFDMTRGEVPQGITATSALRLIESQEQNVSLDGIANRKKRVIDSFNMMAEVMGQYYKKTDARTIRALGPKNEYMFEDVSKTDFTKFYKVAIEKTSSLSESKAGRISDIVELNQVTQTDPVFKKPEIIEILGLGLDQAYRDRATIAITAARSILDKITRGEEVSDPQKYEDLIVHRSVLIDCLQEAAYSNYVTPETQEVIKGRVMTIEYLMEERVRENLKFAQEVSLLSDFPSMFKMHIPLGEIIRGHMVGGSVENQTPEKQETKQIISEPEEV